MKSKVILFCVLLFFSKIVDSTPHSEDHLRQRVNQPSNWHVDQTAQDSQYLETDFAPTRNVNPLTNPAIQQVINEDYYPSQERYNNHDGYGYNKSPVALPSGNYNTQVDGRRLESYPHRVDSYPSQIGFNSHQFRNPNWHSQNQYPNSVPSGVLITDSDRPLVNTVQEPYRGPVQYPQHKYVPSSNPLNQPDRSFLRREQFQHPLADNAHRFGSSGPIPYENLSESQVGVSDVKGRLRGSQRHLQNLVAQAGNIYSEVPAVIAETLAHQSENIKYLENYRPPSDLINTAPADNYHDGSPVIPEIEHFSSESGESNAPLSYESYNNGQVAASDIKRRLTGGRRKTQSFAPQTGIIYEESPAVIPTDTLEEIIDRSRLDLGNNAQITNNDDGSPAISSVDHYSSGSRPNNVRVPYEMYSEAQASAFEVKPKPTGGQRYVHNIAPQSRRMHNNVPAVIATDILADHSKTIKYEKRANSNIATITNQEDSSPVISGAGNINKDSGPSSPTPGNIENQAPVEISKTLSDTPLARKYAHRTESGSSNIVRDDSYNSAPSVISETVQEKSVEKPIPVNTHSGTSSTDTESDVPAHRSSSSIPSNTNLNIKSSSEITELSLLNLLSKTDIEKFMAGNTKRFLIIHPNKTVEYVDNIDIDSHQHSKLRLVNTKPKHVGNSEGEGTLLPENVKDKPVVGTDSNPPIGDLPESSSNLTPHVQQADSGSLKPISPLSKSLTPHQAGVGDTPSTPSNFPEIKPEENKHFKPLRPNKRHPEHNYKTKTAPVNQSRENKSNPSFPDENQQAVERNVKPQPSIENQSVGDDHNSNSSSPDENQQSNDIKAQNLSPNGNKPGDDNNFMPSSPNRRWPAHHHNSKHTDQLTKDSPRLNSSSPDGNQPSHLHKSQPIRNLKNSNLNHPEDVNNANSSSSSEDKPAGDNDTKPEPLNKDRSDDKLSYQYKKRPADGNEPRIDKKSKPSYFKRLGNENDSDQSSPAENQPSDGSQPTSDKNSKSERLNEDKPGDENNSPSSSSDAGSSSSLSKPSPENNTGGDNNSDSLSTEDNQPKDLAKPSDGKTKKSKPLQSRKRKSEHKLKHSYEDKSENEDSSPENKPEDYETSKSSSPDENQPSDGNQPAIDQNSKPQHSNDHQPRDEHNSTSSIPGEYQPVDDSSSSSPSKENQDKASHSITKVKPSHPSKKQSSVYQKPNSEDENTSPENNTANENNSDSLSTDDNQSKDDSNGKLLDEKHYKSKPLKRKRKPAYKKKPKPSNEDQLENDDSSPENKPEDDDISKSSSSGENEPASRNQPAMDKDSEPQLWNEDQPGDENNSTTSTPGEYQPVQDSSSSPSTEQENQDKAVTKPKPSHLSKKQSVDSKKSKSGDEHTSPENKTGDDNDFDLLSSVEIQPKDDTNAKSLDENNNKSKPQKHRRKPAYKKETKPSYEDQSENDNSSPENEPEDEKKSKSSSLYENEPQDDSKQTSPVVSKTDSSDESPATPNYTTSHKPQVSKKHRQIRRKSTTSSPIVSSTTPSSEETSEDQLTTISPIEQVTDNVDDVTPVTTSTSTAKPIETPEKSDTNKEDNNSTNSSSEDLDNNSDKIQASTTTASPSSSITLADDYTSGDKITKDIVENNDKQTNDKAVESQGKKEIQPVQSAVYNSNELLDTNTDGPAESDVYSPVTSSPSVQNDVNTGDATGDDTLELEQPETDVTITVSSNTDNDSEDDVITINVEVSESAGSSGNDKTLLINIDTDDDSDTDDDDSDTSLATPTSVGGQSTDCKKYHNDDDGKSKNLEIDMSNIQGEPTMWIRTTNQDFIEKLTDKNDTAFDIVYFFNMVTQPVIEKEKETIFYCNGTVSITTKEITYPNKDDPTPNIEKKTQTIQIEDYERYRQEKSSD